MTRAPRFVVEHPRFRDFGLALPFATQSPQSEMAVLASVLLPSSQAIEIAAYFYLILISPVERRSESIFIA
jgi:hypothetical protein